ncbi:RNA polymerase, sigma 28 subunit, FliA/WhiG family [Caballeronia jiangsuensis]|nr:RNA polymerase, sigma 28 subunit, FliA/WhiG family [Caballeronia jiangsuensis]
MTSMRDDEGPQTQTQDRDSHDATRDRLWKSFVSTRATAAREALFLHYLPYARALAAQLFAQRHRDDVEFNDFRQFALIGLLEAIDRYDPEHRVTFETFCTPRVKGAVLDGVQKLTDGQEQISFMRRMQRERLNSLKAGEVMEDADKHQTLHAVAHLAAGLAIGYMLDETSMLAPSDNAPSPEPSPWQGIAWRQTKERLLAAVSSMPERHRKIIHYHYFNGLQFDQIASILELSKARISQMHRDALTQLRDHIGKPDRIYMKT